MSVLMIRTVILFVVVVIAVRIMGKRTIGELQASELVITLLISDIAAVPMQEIGVSLLSGVIPIAVLVGLEVLVSFCILRNAAVGRVINGTPIVVINNGTIVQKALRRLRMTNEDLFEGLRKNGCFDILSVKFAIVETDGTLSVMQKNSSSQDNPELTVLLVSDGDIDEHSVKLIGWDNGRVLRTALAEKTDIRDIYIMTGSESGKYCIIKKESERKNK